MCWTSFNHLREMASIFFPVSNRNTMITSTGRGCAVLEAATTHEHVRENGKQKHRFITCAMSPNNPASNSMSTSVIPDMAAASTSLLKKRGKTPNPNESPSSELCPEDVVSDKQIGGGDGGDSVCAGGGGARIVAVNPNPRKCTASKLIDLVEELIIKLFHDGSEFPATLTGNFAPVAEETPPRGDLTVRGRIPECLSGEFIRIGPNPMFVPVAGYSWFDGDGMAHGMRFKDGKVTYVSRYVRTSRLRQEELFGGAKFIKVGDINGLFGIALLVVQVLRLTFKIFDMSYGFGTANTALVYHDGKLLALHEADKPYVIGVLENGDLQTLGMQDYDKRLAHSFTAHPKIDPCTGEMFTYGYSWVPARITYRVVSKDGFMHDPVPITIPAPILSHDFAITENYVIFMDLPLRFTPKDMMQNKQAFLYDATVNARFGILSRYAKDEHSIKWFELPACFIFHAANAWEDGKEVVLITCRTENPALDLLDAAIKGIGTTEFELYEMRFNVSTGLASQKKLSASSVEFPRINEKFIGRKQRYVYTALLKGHGIRGIAKFDLHAEPDESKLKVEVGGNVQGIYQLNSGEFGSEPVFIPRQPGSNSEEDDGYLVFFAHNENTGKSSVYIIDAKTMSADPVAVIELPRRVPYGFHACFVTEEQLREQTLV